MKKTKIAVLLLSLSGLLIFAFPKKTSAIWPFDLFGQKNTSSETSQFPEVIQRIVDKFKLNKDEVQEVINETREQRQQQIRDQQRERLSQAVKEGVLTQQQMENLLKKQEEWQARQSQIMEEQRKLAQEKRDWFAQNNIDIGKLGPFLGNFGFGKKGGFGRGMFFNQP